jgi:uncharacterized protein (TIGR03435 family)
MIPIVPAQEPALRLIRTSMPAFAGELSGFGAIVVDRTGLHGKYDFNLTRLSTAGDPGVDWNVAALGLRLEPIRIPAASIVIDHIEKPAPT